jgi:hypothetical protein
MRDPERSAVGGWIEISLRDGRTVEGELIAVGDDRRLLVLTGRRAEGKPWTGKSLVAVPLLDVAAAKLYAYDGESFWAEGLVGMLTSITSIFLPFVWLAITIDANHDLDQHRVFHYSSHGLLALSRWARFPQGPPAGLRVAPQRARGAPPPVAAPPPAR